MSLFGLKYKLVANATVVKKDGTVDDSVSTSSNQEDKIRELAYLKWEAAGCPEGDGQHFWVEAEQELTQLPGYTWNELQKALEENHEHSDSSNLRKE